MKVLLYSSYRQSTLESQIYEGMKEKLGEGNVVHYTPGPQKRAATKAQGRNATGHYPMEDRMDEFDCIIFFYCAFPDGSFWPMVDKPTSAPKMFVDEIDDFYVRKVHDHPEIRYYLKRELYTTPPSASYVAAWAPRYMYELLRNDPSSNIGWLSSKWGGIRGIAVRGRYKKMRPLPLTVAPKPARETAKRPYDVSFMGHVNCMDRLTYTNAMGRIAAELQLNAYMSRDYLSPRNSLSHDAYLKILLSSKAGLSIRGVGYDTYRYWEIPAYGAALLAQRTPQVIPNNFVDGDSALFFSDRAELRGKVQRYVSKSEEWKEIARNGQRHFLKYHTPEKRAEYVLGLIR